MQEVQNLLKDHKNLEIWEDTLSGGRIRFSILVPMEESESVLDAIEQYYSMRENFRIIILPVEASIPRFEEPEKKPSEKVEDLVEEKPKISTGRISRAELYSDITDASRLSKVFIIFVILSSIVAAIGILNNDVVVIIGAMVIAPLLGPNVALSLATTLADSSLSNRALKTIAAGIITALVFSTALGYFLTVNPAIPEIASRTDVNLGDILLAIASGSAGALAFTTGAPGALVGVMISVALLPPLVTTGLLAGSGFHALALQVFLLFLANFICVNLAGVITFFVQGIRPLSWWEVDKAKKATRNAIILWILLLAALILVISVS